MVPIYLDEIGDDSWEALELLAAFLRLLGFNATAYLKQIWAVGYYDKNRKCPRERAQYCHGFVKVPDASTPRIAQIVWDQGLLLFVSVCGKGFGWMGYAAATGHR